MTALINPKLSKEIARYGSHDISACFHCGNCSAVCPLSEGGESFPRRMIRLGQIGRKDALLASDEPWLCHGCGECTQTCPRQADPQEYMASLRRWTIAQIEPTGIAKALLQNRTWPMVLATLILSLVLGAFLVAVKMHQGGFESWLFADLVAYHTIHAMGLAVGVLLTLSLVIAIARFVFARKGKEPTAKGTFWRAIVLTIGDIVTMRRERCEGENDQPKTFVENKWLIHLLIVSGFIGLFIATSLDFVFLYALQSVFHLTVFWPARILGTIAGAVMLIGVTTAIVRRRNSPDKTRPADAWLLAILWLLAVTGFVLEAAVTVRAHHPILDWVLVVHSVMAMELVLLAGSTKLAHVFYRPIALFGQNRRKLSTESEPSQLQAAE